MGREHVAELIDHPVASAVIRKVHRIGDPRCRLNLDNRTAPSIAARCAPFTAPGAAVRARVSPARSTAARSWRRSRRSAAQLLKRRVEHHSNRAQSDDLWAPLLGRDVAEHSALLHYHILPERQSPTPLHANGTCCDRPSAARCPSRRRVIREASHLVFRVRRCVAPSARPKARRVGSSAPRVAARCSVAVRSAVRKMRHRRRFARTAALRSLVTRHLPLPVHLKPHQRVPIFVSHRSNQMLRRRSRASVSRSRR